MIFCEICSPIQYQCKSREISYRIHEDKRRNKEDSDDGRCVSNVPGNSGRQTNRSSGGYGKWLCWISFQRQEWNARGGAALGTSIQACGQQIQQHFQSADAEDYSS